MRLPHGHLGIRVRALRNDDWPQGIRGEEAGEYDRQHPREQDPPPVSELQPMTPPALGRIVRTCLAKDPDARFQTVHDLRCNSTGSRKAGRQSDSPRRVIANRKRRDRTLWGGVAVLTLAVGAIAAWMLKPAPVITNTTERFEFTLPEGQLFTRTGRRYITLSPDGKRLVVRCQQTIAPPRDAPAGRAADSGNGGGSDRPGVCWTANGSRTSCPLATARGSP